MGNCQQIQNLKDNELNIQNKDNGIFITVKIWSKKSNELFNYEAHSYKELKYDLMKQETLPKQLRHLFWRSEDDGFMIFNPNRSLSEKNGKQQERSFLSKWVNVSSLDKEKGLEIKINDVYKFGNTLLKVNDIYFSMNKNKSNNSFDIGQCGYSNLNDQHCCNNTNCKKYINIQTNNLASIDQQNNQNVKDINSYSQKQKQSSLQGISCSRHTNLCCSNNNGQNNNSNWVVMQKATTMMLSSKYQGTEECNDDLEESYCESNGEQCNIQVQQPTNFLSAAGEKTQINKQGCCHQSQKRSKRSQNNLHQIENQKQCRICLETEDDNKEDKSVVSVADLMWSSIQKSEENDINGNTQNLNNNNNVQANTNNELNPTCYTQNFHYISNNPMISVCGCQGSMKYIHLKCLQTWVKSKQKLNDAFSSKFCEYYSQKAMICELCKKNYPLKININGKKVLLLQLEENEEEEKTTQIQPLSSVQIQESNHNQQSIQNQNNQEQILQIEHDENHENQERDIEEEQEEEIQNSSFENDEADDDENEEDGDDDQRQDDYDQNDNDNEDEDEQEDEEQKTNWDNNTDKNNKKKKKKNKSYDNYVIFEISNSQNTSLNGLIILNLSKTYEKAKIQNNGQSKKTSTLKTVFSLGRQNSCDIKINDITVSRFHAELNVDYEKGRVFLKDTNSKFGTLINLRKELIINTKLDGVQVQINNVCLEFCIGQDPSHEFYQRQILNKKEFQNQSSSTCKFSCFKSTANKTEKEIINNDSNFKYRDRNYNPINQIHDSVYISHQDFSFQQ